MRKTVFIISCLVVTLTAFPQQKLFTVQDVQGSAKFSGKSLQGVRWMKDGKRFSFQELDTTSRAVNVWSYSVLDGKREMVAEAKALVLNAGDPPFRFTTYQWSPDEKEILFVSAPPERQYLSRLTPGGNFFLYEVASKTFRRLTNVSEPQYNQKLSPDGKRLGLVRGNNIYVIDLASGQESQLTLDGSQHIINGKFDWVYEEEFGISDGWQWSPDGKMIAFWRLDENRVPEFKLMDFMDIRADATPMRYPKAGDANSIVKVGVVSLDKKKTVWMDLGTDDDMYIPRMQWSHKPNTLILTRLNRLQNRVELMAGDAAAGKTAVFFTEEEKTWIEERYQAHFLKTRDQFAWISERDGFSHVYLFDMNGKLIRQITKGRWDVSGIALMDEKNNQIFFNGAAKTPLENQLHSVKLDGSGMQQLTLDGYSHRTTLSPSGAHFLDYSSSASSPTKIALRSSDGKTIRVVEENEIPALKEYTLSKQEFFTFKTTDGIELNGWMIKPADFDVARKYPVLLYVYGGPGSQTVTNNWGGTNFLWYQMLAQKGYIVASVDGRGTGARGKEFKSITYKNLGKWEVNDQIEAAKYFGSQAYVDKTRIGIWGWSYGGYMSSLTILQGAEYFKTAIAVAPVTHWKFYDTIYTERYMQRPKDNEEGYKESAPVTHASKLKGNLLIVHGTTDDNVHWQNTVQFVDALQKAGKQFETMYYVNKNHGISGGNTRVHLFDMITNYILEKL